MVSAPNLKPLNRHMHTNHHRAVVELGMEPGEARSDEGSITSGISIVDLPGVIAVGYGKPADPVG